jgi:16S rRNA processing protein RimM
MLCLGVIGATHGLKGCIKVKSYFETKVDFSLINIFINEDKYNAETYFYKKQDVIILKLKEISDCNTAQKLVKSKIYIKRSVFSSISNEDEYYYEDLIGLSIESGNEILGIISSVNNFGASDILEVQLKDSQKKVMIPFTREFCTHVNLKERRIQVTEEIKNL